MHTREDNTAKEEYILQINERNEKSIKKLNRKNNQEINIIFETETETDVMTDVLNQLSKYYIVDILKL